MCGSLRSESMRQKLFAEDDIKFNKAFRNAVTMEVTEVDAALGEDQVAGKSASTSSFMPAVHQLSVSSGRVDNKARRGGTTSSNQCGLRGNTKFGGGPSDAGGAGSGSGRNLKQPAGTDSPKGACVSCGGYHQAEVANFKLYTCRVYNREGHLKRSCPTLQRGIPAYSLQQEQIRESEHFSTDSEELNNFSLDTIV